ncbi:MAG TPA: DUF1800 domain-containing protein [Pirellulales bacterium]|jgi:uncharacterized protein (DUF1800 family)|nr:DUF1800 domain-containing protein [Pirellulales bacterium]
MPALQTTFAAGPAWVPYEPSDAAPWNLQRACHLHRRAAFAAPWDQLQRDLADGPQPAVDRLLHGQSSPDFEFMAQTIGDAATASGSAERLKAWWLFRLLMSPDPLGERLTLMWHNHFATSNRKVQNLVSMREQNDLFRAHARAPFGQLLEVVLKDPAMLVWLDADSNRRGHPNENLARETMELFTLGVGNYSEDDVREAARALTGWTIVGNHFAVADARHDSGEKVVLGHRGPLTGDDFIKLLLEHPATPRRLAWRICQTFMGEGVVDPQSLSQLADGLAAHGLDVAWAVETVLRSKLFFSAENLRTRVAGPVEYVVGALRALELTDPPPSTLLLAEWVARMGQDLFYPPNVGGWNEGRAWLSSRAIVARANFADALVAGELWSPTRAGSVEELPPRRGNAVDLHQSVAWLAGLLWGDPAAAAVREVVEATQSAKSTRPISFASARLMARPEYQLE